ncbi:MAG: DUF1800 family protein [Pseudomonadota bacterium]
MAANSKKERLMLSVAASLILAACVVEEVEELGSAPPVSVTPPPASPPPPPPPPPPPQAPAKPEAVEASRFLFAASFGPTEGSISELSQLGYSEWIQAQYSLPMTSIVEAAWPKVSERTGWRGEHWAPISEFYESAILGDDQLRQRATYALSQILVISSDNDDLVKSDGEGLARYIDILQEGAFGNYRDLLEDVTYSPIMGEYLTFAGNRKADPDMGSAPDENYAREIMQLFTIGLYELNLDGTLKLDDQGRPIETYSTEDITELSKVFTGLWWEGLPFGELRANRTQQASINRMVMHEDQHSPSAKTFLGETVSGSLNGNETISAALDVLFEHPNVAPFLSRQLIQRMTTSNPSPAYVERVAIAFESGAYQLPNGTQVGTGERGDLRAVWPAILLDEEFIDAPSNGNSTFGKVKEPVLRFTQWARMAGVSDVKIFEREDEGTGLLIDPIVMDRNDGAKLGQRPFTAPSVFNFYRPGYTAPGTESANAGMVAPELQITNETAVVQYANFMYNVVLRDIGDGGTAGEYGIVGDYSSEIELAEDPEALISRLDLLLTAGEMTEATKTRLRTLILSIDVQEADREKWLRERVQRAILLTVLSPEFLVQY